ncbi:MAG: 2-hydroxyacid dehydrogenase, partial [Clostridia bacterium]|nr:2-hydroxyacid dehydrogenase [Clostridia bacterium]
MKVAFFDAKPYDREAFDAAAEAAGMELHYYDGRLSLDTVALARGCDAVCVFVNDRIGPAVIDALVELGVRVIALRCAGYNNVDVRYAKGKISVVRVPAYSPHAVAEHAMAMVLAAVR